MNKPDCKVKRDERSRISYSTDGAAYSTWLHLLRDFRFIEGDDFATNAERSYLDGVESYRDYTYPELGTIHPVRFKMWKQLESLHKKYRYQYDKFTDAELTERTQQKFLDEQLLFCTMGEQRKQSTHLVLQLARKHAKRILGDFIPEEVVSGCRFGKKSSYGCPLSLAYIDHKLTDVGAFTTSPDVIPWLRANLPNDSLISEMMADMGVNLSKLEKEAVGHLNLVLAPKSWKIKRPITPLTLLGLYYSFGVGSMVEKRLASNGLDIRKSQQRHAKLVRSASRPVWGEKARMRRLATADLSSASQSLSSELLNAVLPRKWYNALKMTFVRQIYLPSKVMAYTSSVMPMGNGATFPVETLVFYVILKAIAELAGVRGLISVYGDDLIYPSRLHSYVARIFPQLKFKLNLDKTFVKADFRESCGTDMYHGVDVRPAFLPEGASALSSAEYVIWLYKSYNALARRWTVDVIPRTLAYLLSEITRVWGYILRVPPSYPDTAGLKVEEPWLTPVVRADITYAPLYSYFYRGSRWYHFHYFKSIPKKRMIWSEKPYYWLSLQGADDEIGEDSFWETDYSFYGEAPRSPLSWMTEATATKYIVDGKVHRATITKRFLACSSRSLMATQVSQTKKESVSDWF